MFKELLKSDGIYSSMRFALVSVIIMSFILIIAAAVYLLVTGINGGVIDWSGINSLLLGLAAFIGATAGGKWLQKKEETKPIK